RKIAVKHLPGPPASFFTKSPDLKENDKERDIKRTPNGVDMHAATFLVILIYASQTVLQPQQCDRKTSRERNEKRGYKKYTGEDRNLREMKGFIYKKPQEAPSID
ncbi:MAG: hypothetical protein ACRD37_05180, partial [Candidatus Acidiferrales bacterium]